MSNNIDDGSESLRLKQDESLLKDFALIALEKGLAVQHQPLDTLSVHDLARLRQIILTVLDDGPSGRGQWHFYEDRDTSESGADADRLDFCNEIQRQIVVTATKEQHP